MTNQLAAIKTALRDAFSTLSAEEIVELTMEPFQSLREELSAPAAA